MFTSSLNLNTSFISAAQLNTPAQRVKQLHKLVLALQLMCGGFELGETEALFAEKKALFINAEPSAIVGW